MERYFFSQMSWFVVYSFARDRRLSGEVVKNQKSALQLFTSCSPRPSLSVTIRKPHFVATFCAKCTATISAQRVWFFIIGSGRVSEKIPVSGWSSGRVGVSKFTIGYFRVSFLLSGISGYFGYFRVCWVFLGISGYIRVYSISYWVIPETSGLPEILGNTRNLGFTRNIGYYPKSRVYPKYRVKGKPNR